MTKNKGSSNNVGVIRPICIASEAVWCSPGLQQCDRSPEGVYRSAACFGNSRHEQELLHLLFTAFLTHPERMSSLTSVNTPHRDVTAGSASVQRRIQGLPTSFLSGTRQDTSTSRTRTVALRIIPQSGLGMPSDVASLHPIFKSHHPSSILISIAHPTHREIRNQPPTE